MKKIIIFLFSILLFSLASCSNNTLVKEEKDNDIVDVKTKYYNVKFYNYDESLLYEINVEEGSNDIYPYENPTREEDIDYTYKFMGWDKDLLNIKSDLIVHALYEEIDKGFSEIHWF